MQTPSTDPRPRKQPKRADKARPRPAPAKAEPKPPKDEAWDAVDEASWESFPASDAPARWAGRDIAPSQR